MKFKTRLKIAYDMCIKQLATFRISTFLFALVLTLFGIIIYQYRASYNYRLTVEKGFSKPLDEVYYLISTMNSGSDDTYPRPELSNVEGMSPTSKYQICYNTCSCLEPLKEINSKQARENDGIEEVWMFATDFKLYNIELTEGNYPDEPSTGYGSRLYLSEEYKAVTELGEQFVQTDRNGKVTETFYVAGFFPADTVIPSSNVVYNNMNGVYSLQYGIIEFVRSTIEDTGYFYVEDGYTIEDVMEGLREEYSKSNSVATVTSVESAISFMEKNVNKSVRYLLIAALLLTATSMASLLVIQISSIITRGKEYGIWLICNATDRDIVKILILQNFIRFVYAEVMAVLTVNLITRLVLYGENFSKSDITREISNRIITFNIYPALLGIGLIIMILTVIIPAFRLSRMQPVKLVKGDI